MNPLILNRDFKLASDGYIHLVPLGEFPHPSGIVQVIDETSARAIVNRFNADRQGANFPGILIDYDHFSDDPDKRSEAAGWVEEVQLRNTGVWGKPRWTAPGRKAVEDGTYRLVSPVFSAREAETVANAKKLRPLRLLKVALTNDPNLKGMVPLSNRSGVPAADTQNQNQTKPMKSIATRLGLSADASEESVLAEVTKLQNRCTAAEGQLTPLTTERDELKNRVTALDAEQIDAELDARKLAEDKRTKLKPVLTAMKNRAERVAFLDEVIGKPPAKGADKPIHNRSAKTPASVPGQEGGADDEDASRERAAKTDAAVTEYKLANRCTYDQAWNAVRARKPELFGATAGAE